MKAISYISVLVLLTTISCTSGLYTGVEYDDIYFQASDRQLVAARTQAKRQIIENDLRSSDYYDNIYAADTLMSEEYYDAVGYYDDAVNNKGGTTIYNNYYDNYYDYSYASRLNRFYGNYFYPYWRILFTIILQSASVLDILIITAHIIIVLIIIALSITILFIMILSIMVTQDFMAAITDLTDTIPIIHTIPHTITEEAGVITLAYPMFPTQ